MKRIIFVILCNLFACPAHAQNTFSKVFSNYPLDPEAAWAVEEVDDGYIVVSWGDCIGQDVIICGVVSRLNKNGDVIWFKQFDFYPQTNTSLLMQGDKIYVSGSTNKGDKQFVLFCLDMEGDLLWQREYGDPSQGELGPTMAFTSDNSIILSGTKKPGTAGIPSQVVYMVKVDTNGSMVGEYTFDFQNGQSLGRTVIESTAHQIVFSYAACPESCFLDLAGGVATIDDLGNLQWNLEFPFSYEPDLPNVVQIDANTLAANWHVETCLPNHDLNPPALFYMNLSGQILNQYVFENQGLNSINDLEAIWEKGLIGCGSLYIEYLTAPNPIPGGWVFRMDENQTLLWERTFLDTMYQGRTDKLQSITPTSDGGYIAVGRIVNNMTGVMEAHNWILKLDSLGCLQPGCGGLNYITQTEDVTFLKGRDIVLYPNPASSFVIIQLPPDYSTHDLLAFFVSNNGTTVKKTALNPTQTMINVSDISAGIYFCMVAKGNEIISSRRVVIGR